MNNLVQKLMLGCSATAMFTLLVPSARAQQPTETNVETVVSSSSRISISGYEAPTPVTVIDTEKLQRNAYGNIAEDVRQLPQLNSPPASLASRRARPLPARRAPTWPTCAISASPAPWSCSTASAS